MLQVQGTGLGTGQHQQVVHQPDQAVRLALHGCQQRAAPLKIVEGAVFQRFDSAVDDSQRRAQFVSDIGDEGVFGLVRLAQAGSHVVEGFAQAVQFADVAVHRDVLV